MYTSSSLTFFYRYYLPLIFIAFMALIYLLSDVSANEIGIFISFILGLLPMHLLIFGKLRYVKAMHDQLVTSTLNYEEEILYDQIEYIYQSVLVRPAFIKISYRNENGKLTKFYALGSASEQAFTLDVFHSNELQLTKFIRRKVKAAQPEYDEDHEPSRWTFPLIFLVCILGIVLTTALIENF